MVPPHSGSLQRQERFVVARPAVAVSVVVAILPWMHAAFGIDNSASLLQLSAIFLFLVATALGTMKWPGLPTFSLGLGAVAVPVAITFVLSDKLVAVAYIPLVAVVLASVAWVYSPGWTPVKTALDWRRTAGLGFVFLIPAWWVVCVWVVEAINSLVQMPFREEVQFWFASGLSLLIGTGWAVALVRWPMDRMVVGSFIVGFALFLVTVFSWGPVFFQGECGAIIPIVLAATSELIIAIFMPWQSIGKIIHKENS